RLAGLLRHRAPPRAELPLRLATAERRRPAVEGELTIKGNSHPLQAHGSVSGPSVGLDGSQRLGLTLETTIDRTLYGLNWNAPLPKGGFALANDVKLIVELELALEEE